MTKSKKATLSAASICIVALALFSACGQDYNSNSGDDILSLALKVDCTVPANSNLCVAGKVMQKRCFACHRTWLSFETSQAYVDAGLITAGDPDNSKLIKRLINKGGDMPPTGGALPSPEYDAIVQWVQSP